MIWTIALVGTTGLGTILAAHSWRGWALMAASEILWAIYALSIHATPLLVMAFIWLFINLRNVWVTFPQKYQPWRKHPTRVVDVTLDD